MADNDWKSRLNVVYSTNPDFEYETEAPENIPTLPPQQQELRVWLDRKSRAGKQVTLAHVIASPDPIIYRKLGLDPKLDYNRAAIGILSLSPAEISVIAADIAMKKANIDMGFIDRFSGTLLFTGKVAEVENAIIEINLYLKEKLGFTICEVTRT